MKMIDFPQTGKIQNDFFQKLIFPFCGKKRKEVKTGPAFGVDVSIIELSDNLEMALSSDPLSLIPTLGLSESAWLSVQLLANDMATTGKSPMYAQFVLNLPPDLSAEDFETYWKFIHKYCKENGTAITGGHSGRFEGQNSTVSGGGTMITIANKGEMISSQGGQAGDMIIVTKECALISTAILALSFPETIKKHCGNEIYNMASELFYQSTALKDGLIAAGNNKDHISVTAMHDATEGGVLGAIYELAVASECGLKIESEKLPLGEAQQEICRLFEIDPRYCIGAGSMIIAVKKDQKDNTLENLKQNGIQAVCVGELTEKSSGMKIIENDKEIILNHPGIDPYWNAFFNAYKKDLK